MRCELSELARGMVLTGLDQLWVADITYIRLETEFVYLAVILDAYSKQIVASAKRTQRAIVLEHLPGDSPSEQGSARAASGSAQLGLL